MQKIRVIIPAFNEENAIGDVLKDIPKDLVEEIIVVNNNSNDQTVEVARKHCVTVLDEPIQGYGNACLKGLEYLDNLPDSTDVVVFLDADYSDYPEEMVELIASLEKGNDLVIGSRAIGKKQKGSMTPQQIFGNALATFLIRVLHGYKYSDLGPFRAIRWKCLKQLEMEDRTYGWTVEMQIKAVKHGLKIAEVPVKYRVRIGKSKISGTIKGTIMAGYKIIGLIFKYL